MKFTILLTLFSSTLATPIDALAHEKTIVEARLKYKPCPMGPKLYPEALCCATDGLEWPDVDCTRPHAAPVSANNFSAMCAEIKDGYRARCCILPWLNEVIMCTTPSEVVDYYHGWEEVSKSPEDRMDMNYTLH